MGLPDNSEGSHTRNTLLTGLRRRGYRANKGARKDRIGLLSQEENNELMVLNLDLLDEKGSSTAKELVLPAKHHQKLQPKS